MKKLLSMLLTILILIFSFINVSAYDPYVQGLSEHDLQLILDDVMIPDKPFVLEQSDTENVSASNVVYGDLDKDGDVTSEDALLCLKASVGITELTSELLKFADVDGDNDVDSGDALLILKYSVGIIDIFPVKEKEQITKKILDVDFISQTEKYPTGCESVSAVMAANYIGIDISVDDFIDNYLDKGSVPKTDSSGKRAGPSPWEKFIGSPYSTASYGCYAPVIANAFNKFIDKDKYEVLTIYDESVESLCKKYINNDIPVIFWATKYMIPTVKGTTWYIDGTEEEFTWRRNEHCLLLVGYDEKGYYFNDPLSEKNTYYTKSEVESAYASMYSMAVVVKKIDSEKERTGIVTLQSGYLNIRSAPNLSSQIIDKAYDGQKITVLGEQGNFYKVRFNGNIGFASKDYIRLV